MELQCTHPGGCKGPPDLFIIPLRDGSGCFDLDDPPVFNRSVTKVLILAPEPVYLFGERSVNPALATYVDLVLDIKIDHEYVSTDGYLQRMSVGFFFPLSLSPFPKKRR